jgi:hypothetical protein
LGSGILVKGSAIAFLVLTLHASAHAACVTERSLQFCAAPADQPAEFSGRGILAVEPPAATPWGTREMLLKDPDGNRLRFASESSSVGAL